MDKKSWIIVFIAVIILIIVGMFLFQDKKIEQEMNNDLESNIEINGDFVFDLTRIVHDKKNYLISPYSIQIALAMLRDGLDNNSKLEIEKVIGNKKINIINLKDKLNIANALFLKNEYKNSILDSYYNNLKNNYNADVLYDNFETPKVINDWVNEKTSGMIKKILETIDSDFVFGLANAIMLDVKWNSKFECNLTKSEEFTKIDNSKIYVEMMHQSFKSNLYKYIDTNEVLGIILPYEIDSNIEFIGLLPKDINAFINNLSTEKLNNILSSSKEIKDKEKLELAIPRFDYEYEIEDLIKVLRKLGINDVFNPSKADLSKAFNLNNTGNLYVDTAIHKTKIELGENGTKAAAVTYFGIKNTAVLPDDERVIDITFNKPFVYIIRDKNTNEVIFIGSVFEPSLWKGSTCN